MRLRRWLSREHGARHESRRGSCKVGVKSIDRRGASELSSRWRTMLSRPITRVETRGTRIHSIGRHLPNRGPVSGRRLNNCRWWSSTTLV